MHETAEKPTLTLNAVAPRGGDGVDEHRTVNIAVFEHGVGGRSSEMIAESQPVPSEIVNILSFTQTDRQKFERVVTDRFQIAGYVELALTEIFLSAKDRSSSQDNSK